MLRYRCFWAVILAMVVLGCNQQPGAVVKKVQATPPVELAKSALQEVVKTGEVGSGLEAVQSYADGLKATDAGKADAIAKGLTDLQKMGSKPEEAKAAAKELLGKL